MVEQEAHRTARGLTAFGFIALALAAALPAMAHPDKAPSTGYCDALPVDPETISPEQNPLALPDDWKDFAKLTDHWIAVKTRSDTTHCVSVDWILAGEDYERFDDRFAGFEWTGYEAWGYILIDTAGTGRDIDTGARPVFSPHGYSFATIQFSDAGWGGFEGFAIWRIAPKTIEPIHVTTDLPSLTDWRIDRWEDEDCLHLSAVPWDRIDGNWDNLPRLARDHYVAAAAKGWEIMPGEACPTYDAP